MALFESVTSSANRVRLGLSQGFDASLCCVPIQQSITVIFILLLLTNSNSQSSVYQENEGDYESPLKSAVRSKNLLTL